MAFDKGSVQIFNGKLYFHLYKNPNAGILTSLRGLTSSSLITVAH